ncbi:MAG: zf-TFIIB domain-containing protein [Gammaproteobacteria bacterium]|nr:zf-TFIIB domain-containing protein [Gammaproteobacteria bacterium]MBU1504842.1 zf-TFIIB domain-containing protein [Gammaproteobacteria bacterium]MBU2122447.1 zf-TFIIB domain-containing protein [Gammaproteobacteria bacterium]MBU2172115.1 zf-TFIIB domain-containing protein [Gammaproteobacteria bacterium]MBU2198859.1 zf-TFIIB domain-containing protein [Gammaproteobacteria bacterium]
MTTRLHCSCASRSSLTNAALEEGLPAVACPDCGAVLLQMDDWRRWRSRSPDWVASPDAPGAVDVPADQGQARACPACARLMQRLAVDAQGDFRVDRCGPCQYLWLDRGEWQALVQRGLAQQLDTLLSDGGQRRLQTERLQATRMLALRQRHGDACMDEVLRIRRWLAEQPHRDEVLALIRATEPLNS